MAGASMKDIKLRIKSVESTMQITKAMELGRFLQAQRSAKERQETDVATYFDGAQANRLRKHRNGDRMIFASALSSSSVKSKSAGLIVIAGDRGLAGGYNSNVFAICPFSQCSKKVPSAYCQLASGAVDFFARNPRIRQMLTTEFAEAACVYGFGLLSPWQQPDYKRIFATASMTRLRLVYTRFCHPCFDARANPLA